MKEEDDKEDATEEEEEEQEKEEEEKRDVTEEEQEEDEKKEVEEEEGGEEERRMRVRMRKRGGGEGVAGGYLVECMSPTTPLPCRPASAGAQSRPPWPGRGPRRRAPRPGWPAAGRTARSVCAATRPATRGSPSPTFQLNVSTFCGMGWVGSVTKTAQVETAQVEQRSGRVEAPHIRPISSLT